MLIKIKVYTIENDLDRLSVEVGDNFPVDYIRFDSFFFNLKRLKFCLIILWISAEYAGFPDKKEETGKCYFGQFRTR